jgi:hypothetical protein
MKLDKAATKEARYRQIEAINRMNAYFGVDAAFLATTVSPDQRWLSKSKTARRIYRRARIAVDPKWAARRERRKRQRRARKVNR